MVDLSLARKRRNDHQPGSGLDGVLTILGKAQSVESTWKAALGSTGEPNHCLPRKCVPMGPNRLNYCPEEQ
jgi:hypothetical protein